MGVSNYDFLIVGAGPFGAAFARTATDLGKRCLVIDRREHIAGNMFTKKIEGIDVHMYGPHIFHTENRKIWDFVNQFGSWARFRFSPRVRIGQKMYSFPINLLTLHQLWGVATPSEARAKLDQVRIPCENPQNAEDWLLSQVGRDLYEIFFKGYTKKQWCKEPKDLPASIVARIPIRLTYNDAYFRDKYQAIPRDGYTGIIQNMLDGIDLQTGVDFYDLRDSWKTLAKQLVFTGSIDQYFGYQFGKLEYRSLRFEMEVCQGDFQGNAVVNYPSEEIEFTRITEHKHFAELGPKHIVESDRSPTVITKDFPIPPSSQTVFDDPHYPIRDAKNTFVYDQYVALADLNPDVLFGGRLGEYRYYDMDQVFGSAIMKAQRKILGVRNGVAG